jgi:hypothetical protein
MALVLAGAGLFAPCVKTAFAQQDEEPILKPKKPSAKLATTTTLLMMCDLACNWKLDGEAKAHIDRGRIGQSQGWDSANAWWWRPPRIVPIRQNRLAK